MSSKEQLQQQLRTRLGRDVVPIAKMVNVSSLTLDQLKKLSIENNLELFERRELMEKKLSGETGCNEFIVMEEVEIDSLNVIQLENLLANCMPAQNVSSVMENSQGDDQTFAEALSGSKKTIGQVQQEMAENCGLRQEIIWDLLSSNDKNVMRAKIRELIPDREKGQNAIHKLREDIFTNVWAQRKYTNGASVTSIFYVMVTKNTDFNTVLDSDEFSCHPVFRCKKCDNQFNSSKCCMVYVDETGRVYQNWKSYLEENVLPAGTMVAPRNGIYNFKDNKVILDIYCTPNGTTGAQIMNVAQTGTAVAGIGAACVPIAALALPIAAPIVATAGLIGLGVGAFSTVASVFHLVDRKKHEKSISVTDKEARSSYLGVLGGVVGIAAAGATRAMTSIASAGKATAGIEVLVNGINITSIVLSGSGVANGVLDLILKYSDDDKITTLDVLQLSASLVIFTHSVYNFQLASQIANNARVNSIKSYRETLSNRQRKMFDKLSKETIRIRGSTQGKIDVLRGINEIPDRQYLNDLFKVNKQLNQRNVRAAYGQPGKGIILNNEVHADTASLRQNIQHGAGPNILEQVSQPIPPTHNTDTYTTVTPKAARLLFSSGKIQQNVNNLQDSIWEHKTSNSNCIAILRNLAISLPEGFLILLQQYGNEFINKIVDGHKFEDVILSMADNLSAKTFKLLMRLSQQFIENELQNIQNQIGFFITTESVLYRILKHVLDNCTDLSYENISQKSNEILNTLKTFYLSFNSNNRPDLLKKCPDCEGYFCITDV